MSNENAVAEPSQTFQKYTNMKKCTRCKCWRSFADYNGKYGKACVTCRYCRSYTIKSYSKMRSKINTLERSNGIDQPSLYVTETAETKRIEYLKAQADNIERREREMKTREQQRLRHDEIDVLERGLKAREQALKEKEHALLVASRNQQLARERIERERKERDELKLKEEEAKIHDDALTKYNDARRREEEALSRSLAMKTCHNGIDADYYKKQRNAELQAFELAKVTEDKKQRDDYAYFCRTGGKARDTDKSHPPSRKVIIEPPTKSIHRPGDDIVNEFAKLLNSIVPDPHVTQPVKRVTY